MDKEEILKNYKKKEDRLLVARILDQIMFCNKRNKIQNTNFLDLRQINLLERILHHINITNYIIYGGFPKAERQVIVFYPDKLNKDIIDKNYDLIICQMI